MDIESYRRKKVKYFIESIGLTYCDKWKTFINDLGVQVTEELKLVTDQEWDIIVHNINTLTISKMQRRKLDIAIQNLKSTGPADLSINNPLPLKSASSCTCLLAFKI